VDLEPDTQTLLFNQKVLKVNPVKLHDAGEWAGLIVGGESKEMM